jgi:subtilisin family serine protease
MKFLISAAIILYSLMSFQAHASDQKAEYSTTVGIVDSGFYMKHTLLKEQLWINPEEVKNRLDDDGNGYVDDLHGWNFAENSKFLFDIQQITGVQPLTYKLMSIASKMSAGIETEEEKKFIEENLINLPVPERNKRIAELNFYGQYAHGTHVAGLVAKNDPAAKLVNLKFFPASYSPVRSSTEVEEKDKGFVSTIENFIFEAFATLSNQSFQFAGDYINDKKVDVANMSLGIPMERLASFALIAKGNLKPTDEELAIESQKIYKKFEEQALLWVSKAEDTLFVAASGNSGLNNDIIPAFPANVDHPNIVSVGASVGYDFLPEFSNYGMSVDLVAPGTAALSSAPGPTDDFEIEMTGTSMAAPYVAGVASGILSRNPKLTPLEVKRILLETVDVKEWLKGKVLTSGIVNKDRAFMAAELSVADDDLDQVIVLSKVKVSDVESSGSAAIGKSLFSPLSARFTSKKDLRLQRIISKALGLSFSKK